MPRLKQIILGIDPGVATTGYGIIEKIVSQLTLIDYGCILTKAKTPLPERFQTIHQELKKIIKKYNPSVVAVEELFFFKNVKTALIVGQARGVVLLTAIQKNLPVYEYTPLQVKQATTTYGRADKQQVQQMVKAILNLKEIPKPDDAADALAVAICCANSLGDGV
ncbi:MAG TPA: crossover junction endodeoxyribonuclease RuvC [Patescibacteria group bacterium]